MTKYQVQKILLGSVAVLLLRMKEACLPPNLGHSSYLGMAHTWGTAHTWALLTPGLAKTYRKFPTTRGRDYFLKYFKQIC
jgi:hypothetical protein